MRGFLQSSFTRWEPGVVVNIKDYQACCLGSVPWRRKLQNYISRRARKTRDIFLFLLLFRSFFDFRLLYQKFTFLAFYVCINCGFNLKKESTKVYSPMLDFRLARLGIFGGLIVISKWIITAL